MTTYFDCWAGVATALFSQALAGEPELAESLPKPLGAGSFGLAAAIAGPCIGIAWYVAKYPDLLLDAHPMFVGMIASIVVITVSTLLENGSRMRFNRSRKGVVFALVALAGVVMIAVWGPELLKAKLLPAVIGYSISFLFISVLFLIRRTDEKGSALEVP